MSISDDPSGMGQSLMRALANTGISVVYFGQDLSVRWAENLPPSWSSGSIVDLKVFDFLPAEAAAQLVEAKRQAVAQAGSNQIEIAIPASDGPCWYSIWIDCDRGPDGSVRGLMTTAVDITEQKRREQTLRTLLREVAHRSKNLLAIIQSIATQTGRHSGTVESFLTRFRGRLQSLASTQDLVTSSNWRGADLHDLIIGQVGRYTADSKASISIQGEKPYLNPNAALHIGLALHELAVNSVSYGALSRPEGNVVIRADRVDGPTPGTLALVWSEAISIADQAVGEKRFGSVALERIVPASVNGSATLDLSADRLTYTLLIPPGSFELA